MLTSNNYTSKFIEFNMFQHSLQVQMFFTDFCLFFTIKNIHICIHKFCEIFTYIFTNAGILILANISLCIFNRAKNSIDQHWKQSKNINNKKIYEQSQIGLAKKIQTCERVSLFEQKIRSKKSIQKNYDFDLKTTRQPIMLTTN